MKIDSEKMNDAMANGGVFAKDICKRTGITDITFQKISKGEMSTDLVTVGKIATVLNVGIRDITEGGEHGE